MIEKLARSAVYALVVVGTGAIMNATGLFTVDLATAGVFGGIGFWSGFTTAKAIR